MPRAWRFTRLTSRGCGLTSRFECVNQREIFSDRECSYPRPRASIGIPASAGIRLASAARAADLCEGVSQVRAHNIGLFGRMAPGCWRLWIRGDLYASFSSFEATLKPAFNAALPGTMISLTSDALRVRLSKSAVVKASISRQC
jgi:hypothetical protein